MKKIKNSGYIYFDEKEQDYLIKLGKDIFVSKKSLYKGKLIKTKDINQAVRRKSVREIKEIALIFHVNKLPL